MKKLIILITIFLAVIGIASTPISAMADSTSVLDDLKGIDMASYQADQNKSMDILTFAEVAYPYYGNLGADYALYIYIYNPKLETIDKTSTENKIQISFDGNNYSKYRLKFVGVSEAPYLNVVYKYKVLPISEEFIDIVNREKRTYSISGVELVVNGNTIEILHGYTYEFSGYAKGYGEDKEQSTISVAQDKVEVVELEVTHDVYRLPSAKGNEYQTQINSVYFNIDNDLLDYGSLHQIKYSAYEHDSTDIIVTDNDEIYNNLSRVLGQYVEEDSFGNYFDDNIGFTLYTDKGIIEDGAVNAEWGYNGDFNDFYKEEISKLNYAFKVTDKSEPVSSATLSKYIEDNSNNSNIDLFMSGGGYMEEVISIDDNFNVLNAEIEDSFWSKYFGYWFGFDSSDYSAVKPIQEVNLLNINDMYITDKDNLKSAVTSAVLKGESTYVFHFANTEYFSQDLNYKEYTTFSIVQDAVYRARQTIFLDFDIIELTFYDEVSYTTIPVVMNPIDIIGSIEPPSNFFNDLINNIKEKGQNALDWIKIILIVIAGIIILAIVIWLIGLAVDLVKKIAKK